MKGRSPVGLRPFSSLSEKTPDRRQPQKPSAEIKTSLRGSVGHAKWQKTNQPLRIPKRIPHRPQTPLTFPLTLAGRSIVRLLEQEGGPRRMAPIYTIKKLALLRGL